MKINCHVHFKKQRRIEKKKWKRTGQGPCLLLLLLFYYFMDIQFFCPQLNPLLIPGMCYAVEIVPDSGV